MSITPINIIMNINDKYQLPKEVSYHIQKYMRNDIVYKALQKHFDHLNHKKELCDDEAYEKYIYPKCRCSNNPDNGLDKWFRRVGKDCNACFEFECKEHSGAYTSPSYRECIIDNPQYTKIMMYPSIAENDYYEEYYECYEYDDIY